MDDRFDERLRSRLSALDAAVPTEAPAVRGVALAPVRRLRTGARATALLPLGLVLALIVAVVGVALLGASHWPTQNGAAPASGRSPTPQSPAPGMVVADAQAVPIPGSGNPVIVTATITNGTDQDDKLVGASSPVAATAGLYATSGCLCTLAPSETTGMPDLVPMPWWLIKPNETIQLRAGAGKIVLNGLAHPLTAGQTVEVTFKFAYAQSVTVEVPVIASGEVQPTSELASAHPLSTMPGQTPSPADVAAAKDAVERYNAALVRGDYAAAYAMLAPQSQRGWHSLADYTSERSAYFHSVAGHYVVEAWPADTQPITTWLTDDNRASIDLSHAVLIKVDYPAIASPAGWDMFIVSPGPNGLEIFDVR
jgi:copper(I)-binding protein